MANHTDPGRRPLLAHLIKVVFTRDPDVTVVDVVVDDLTQPPELDVVTPSAPLTETWSGVVVEAVPTARPATKVHVLWEEATPEAGLSFPCGTELVSKSPTGWVAQPSE